MHDTPPPNDGSEWWAPGHWWVHETTGNNYRAWFNSVEQLTAAALRLFDDTSASLPDGQELMLSHNSVSAMLAGLAIECALKGLWVRAGEKIIQNSQYVGIPGARDHELGQLAGEVAKHVHLPLNPNERDVLDRLSSFILWAGRYPVDRTPKGMKIRKTASGRKQVPNFFSAQDFKVASRLLNRFTTALSPHFDMFKLAARSTEKA